MPTACKVQSRKDLRSEKNDNFMNGNNLLLDPERKKLVEKSRKAGLNRAFARFRGGWRKVLVSLKSTIDYVECKAFHRYAVR